jgi:putative transposase
VLVKMRDGEKAYVDEAEPFDRSATTRPAATTKIWDGDHHQFDVIVNAGGGWCRPWLTAWQDMRSRMIVGWVIRAEDPNTEAILVRSARAVLQHGVPEVVYHDNGKDYDSFALHGRTKKDRWERRRLKLPLDPSGRRDLRRAGDQGPLGAGRTTGRASRSSGSSGRSSSRRRSGRPTAATRPATSRRTCSSSSSAARPRRWRVRRVVREWLEAGYHQKPHTGNGMDGRSPAAVHAECLVTKRTAPASCWTC